MEYKVSKAIFSRETLLKVVYLWQEGFVISISEDDNNYIVEVSPKGDGVFNFGDFTSQLQEQQLRETLNSQFGSLRNSIYSKAFAHFTG